MQSAPSDPAPADAVAATLDAVYRQLVDVNDGQLATYIPPLSLVDPGLFGLAVCSPDGQLWSAGDHDQSFSIQSISKVFALALALSDRGLDSVLERVGCEPSGESFNAISLEAGTGRPDNPMINAGAIVTCSLVAGDSATERFGRILSLMSACAGRDLIVDEMIFQAELETADKNRALAFLMRSAGSLTADVDETLEVYLRQCAVLVTADDLAVMAATLAGGGVNPVTGVRTFTSDVARHVLTIMATCGMYDYSGEWMLRVGSPAKSGVAGGVITASPATFGLGLYSPLLDEQGNSVRAVQACELLAEQFSWHALAVPGEVLPAVQLPRRQ